MLQKFPHVPIVGFARPNPPCTPSLFPEHLILHPPHSLDVYDDFKEAR